MIPHFLNQVAAFHRAFQYRQPEPVAPDLSDKPTNELRPRLLREELHELHDATTRVDQLDALCDSQYVLSGAVLAWGYRSLFENHRHTIELRKIHDERGHLAAMLGLVDQMEMAAESNLQMQTLTCLIGLQQHLSRAVYHYGFAECFKDAFDEVHRSNMTKLWDAPKPNGLIFVSSAGKFIARRGDGKIVKPETYSPASLARFV